MTGVRSLTTRTTVISGLLSAPEYKPHPLNYKKICILYINKPQVPTGTLKQINFTQPLNETRLVTKIKQ